MFSLNTLCVLVICLIVIVFVNLVLTIIYIFNHLKCKNKYKMIWDKFDNKNLEQDIEMLIQNIQNAEKQCESSQIICSEINAKMLKCIQKVGFIKYDAYETGNNGLSFALALLDTDNNGILLNSVYNRTYSNLYAKEITKGQVQGNLSQEENKALIKALNDKSFM